VYAERISVRPGAGALDVPSNVVQQDEGIQNQLSALKQSCEEAYKQKNRERINALEPQVANLAQQFKEHVKMLRQKYPLFAATKYPQPMDLEQTAVRPDEWTLAYQVTDTGMRMWLLKGKDLVKSRFTPLARKELDQLVRTFRKPLVMDEITRESLLAFKDAIGTGKRLFDLLVGDFLASIPEGQPLIVVPDGILGVLPFEMLVIKEGQGWNTSAQRPYPEGVVYFGDRNPISYYQSLTALTLARTLGKQQKTGDRTLAMVDPVFDKDDKRFIQLAREKQQQQRASLDAIRDEKLMSIKSELGLEFPRLALTSQLGEALKKVDPGKTDLYSGLRAEKSVLFGNDLKPYRFCVFAAHGYVGEGLPGIMEPVLILTLVDQPKDKDGFLRMSEVMSIDLTADVVALTACQTGLGREVKGEGTMGMGRAFQYAGAKSVLMSLWRVSEVSTTKMAEKFL